MDNNTVAKTDLDSYRNQSDPQRKLKIKKLKIIVIISSIILIIGLICGYYSTVLLDKYVETGDESYLDIRSHVFRIGYILVIPGAIFLLLGVVEIIEMKFKR